MEIKPSKKSGAKYAVVAAAAAATAAGLYTCVQSLPGDVPPPPPPPDEASPRLKQAIDMAFPELKEQHEQQKQP